ncbi:MAG: hypothetical protein EOM08_08725 [Clostridia bacterium]|nr:hypothetical protein [Clostridia bacterium]
MNPLSSPFSAILCDCDGVLNGSDLERKKSFSDIYLLAAERLATSPALSPAIASFGTRHRAITRHHTTLHAIPHPETSPSAPAQKIYIPMLSLHAFQSYSN